MSRLTDEQEAKLESIKSDLQSSEDVASFSISKGLNEVDVHMDTDDYTFNISEVFDVHTRDIRIIDYMDENRTGLVLDFNRFLSEDNEPPTDDDEAVAFLKAELKRFPEFYSITVRGGEWPTISAKTDSIQNIRILELVREIGYEIQSVSVSDEEVTIQIQPTMSDFSASIIDAHRGIVQSSWNRAYLETFPIQLPCGHEGILDYVLIRHFSYEHEDACDVKEIAGVECTVIPVETTEEAAFSHLKFTGPKDDTMYNCHGYHCDECNVLYEVNREPHMRYLSKSFVPQFPHERADSRFNGERYVYAPICVPPYSSHHAKERIESYFSNEGKWKPDRR